MLNKEQKMRVVSRIAKISKGDVQREKLLWGALRLAASG